MKMRKGFIGAGFFALALALSVWFFHQNAQAQALPRGMKVLPSQYPQVIAFEPPVVNLPAGQKFVSYIPDFTSEAMSTDDSDAYILRERDAGEKPHRYAYTKPGNSPGHWEVKFYIQEH